MSHHCLEYLHLIPCSHRDASFFLPLLCQPSGQNKCEPGMFSVSLLSNTVIMLCFSLNTNNYGLEDIMIWLKASLQSIWIFLWTVSRQC